MSNNYKRLCSLSDCTVFVAAVDLVIIVDDVWKFVIFLLCYCCYFYNIAVAILAFAIVVASAATVVVM